MGFLHLIQVISFAEKTTKLTSISIDVNGFLITSVKFVKTVYQIYVLKLNCVN